MRYTTSLTAEQLKLFLAANGLSVGNGGRLLTPGGHEVGIVSESEAFHFLTLHEEGYTVREDGNEAEVKAWWPGFRTAWIISFSEHEPCEIGPTLGPDEVICDLCNEMIVTRPVPVLGTYALCPECFGRTGLRFPGSVPPYVPEALHGDILDYYQLLQIRIQEILAGLSTPESTGVQVEDEADLLAIGAVIVAAKCILDLDSETVRRLWQRARESYDEAGSVTLYASDSDIEALEELRVLVEAMQPVAQALDTLREAGAQWVLINPVHPEGASVLLSNDTGVYDDPWEALADLAEAQREYDNPDIYLARVVKYV